VESLRDDKRQLRAAARAARATAFARHGSASAAELAAQGLDFAGIASATVVSGFTAIGEEIDPLPLLLRLAQEGHRLCLPVMTGKREPLTFRLWLPGDATCETVWGIREPLTSAPVIEPDVLLVPLLAFDAAGGRLGYGGGFYDRTIARLRAQKPIVTIGIAFAEQQVDNVPRSHHDERLDWVLTPAGPTRCVPD
jgi:5-formyltetrahydrofolate cyclo-ligase